MRIIGGELKGRRIYAPKNFASRPTTDKAKESLFNILNNRIYFDDVKVLDLFAGTGSISLEFISRGAVSVDSVDKNRASIQFIKETGEKFHLPNLNPVQSDYKAFLNFSSGEWDIIFADPPYDLQEPFLELPDMIFEKKLLAKEGIFILEHSKAYSYADHPYFLEERKYGRVHFTFFAWK